MEAGTDSLGSYSQSGEVQPLVTRYMEISIIPNISITGYPRPQEWGEGEKDDSGSWQGTGVLCMVTTREILVFPIWAISQNHLRGQSSPSCNLALGPSLISKAPFGSTCTNGFNPGFSHGN